MCIRDRNNRYKKDIDNSNSVSICIRQNRYSEGKHKDHNKSNKFTKDTIDYIYKSIEHIKKNVEKPIDNIIVVDELDKNLGDNFNLLKLDKIFQVILKSATYEILYKPNVSIRIIIKEYLDASNLFLNDSQTKYLNALLDNAAKRLRSTNA